MRTAPAAAGGGRTAASLLSAVEWMLPSPATQVHAISVLPSHSPSSPHHHFAFSNLTTAPKRRGGKGAEEGNPRFEVVRDDLLHPLANGNKARKLDALLPLLRRCGATDVVTCGGCQSAHAAATGEIWIIHLNLFSSFHLELCKFQFSPYMSYDHINWLNDPDILNPSMFLHSHAQMCCFSFLNPLKSNINVGLLIAFTISSFPPSAVHCAEWGMRPHILLRGEQPDVPTGYNLISLMFGNVTYASRSVYAHRDEILYEHAKKVAGTRGKVFWADDIVREDLALDEDNGCEIGPRRVIILKEGAGNVQALLGVMRLVEYLYNLMSYQKDDKVHLVVDAGTGTTAVGLALGATAVEGNCCHAC
ncbi:hypothetical protein GUJ93_ZPchr0007g5496 [Zizania palustris]|uniref:Tryptophan synthase beta chain-like PALP domain-containing protein n=1 Tax=Zizania palustris TaxID=103762 RepID=A0A8J5SPQ1_ZIZPA|nr:hypothetical protein GUJ93_ZPchr0007g5496 [Zizania palustris]